MRKMEKQLNESQRKLVEENHESIFRFMAAHGLEMDAVEDWYGICAIGLCEAALDYTGGEFEPFAYKYMESGVESVLA